MEHSGGGDGRFTDIIRTQYGYLDTLLYFVKGIEAIERVKRQFTKRLQGYGNYSYPERFCLLQLHSLEVRRLVVDLMWCYKIVFHVVDVCIDEFFSFTHCMSTRGHPYKLYKPHFSTITRANFLASVYCEECFVIIRVADC